MGIGVALTTEIAGYQILEPLYSGSRTVVYRAIRQADQSPVVIKLLRRTHPTFSELLQFRNQYAITRHLDLPGLIRLQGLEPHGHSYALIMDDFEGESLRTYAKGQPLPIDQVLAIALQLTDTLHTLNQHHIIHKDIKPANILIHPDTLQIKLIDFSIASLLPKETQDIKNPNCLEGTLAYISPEQTGRMNRGIDYRSDFYSFGITLFELLTGQLPFQSEDPLELVHCHIAQSPPSVARLNPNVPVMLSDVVAKLMAKNAEDRYQTALGLKHDLAHCCEQWQTSSAILPFQLGQRDTSNRFMIPEALYGREQEVQTLLSAFDRVAAGAAELMLVAGFSGIGKTAVVNEVHKPIVRQRGYFIKGKFDQFNRNIPFSAFLPALRDLMGQLLSESDAQLDRWRAKILAALGDGGQVIIDVLPELERIIGPQPTLPDVSGATAQNRFNLLFQNFIHVFTTPEHPLVMFLDDLQWADLASLKLMQLLMTEGDRGHLLLIGAYRDNEVLAAHPLMLTLEDIRSANATIHSLVLAPLSQGSLNQLVADTLNCATDVATPLTKLIYQKTQGNPFFSTQFLKALYEDGLIRFDGSTGTWQCDIAAVTALAMTDDVVEFMALQLQKLPSSTQTVLKLAACVGNQFDLATLAIVSEQSEPEAAQALWPALQEGLILPQNEIYKFYLSGTPHSEGQEIEAVTYKFFHDRVQQAAYCLVPEDQKQATHLKIGQRLLQETPIAQQEDRIFEIVNQLNRGIDLLTQPADRDQLVQLNLTAGRKAKASTAYSAAVAYYQQGIELLPEPAWQYQYEITLDLYQEGAEAAYLSTEFDQMEQWADVVLAHAQAALDQVNVYEVKIQACIAKNQLRQGVETAWPILRLLGIDLPQQPTQADIFQALQATATALAERGHPSELVDLPRMTDPQPLAALRILASMFGAAYNGFPELLPLLITKQVNVSLASGNAPLSAFAYVSYGFTLCAFAGELDTGYQFGELALKLIDHLPAKELQARVSGIFNNCIRHWKAPLKETFPSLLEGYQSGLETGDLEWAGWCIFGYSFYCYCSGKELMGLEAELDTYGAAIANLKQTTALNYHNIYHQAVLNLLGKSAQSCHLVGSAYDEDALLPQHQVANDRPAIYHVYINKIILSYLFGDYQQGLDQAAIAEAYTDGVPGLFVRVLLPFYDSLLRLALYPNGAGSEPNDHWTKITTNQVQLKQWADHAPTNHGHKHDLVEAERYRVLGQYAEAMEWYDRAIAGAEANGYLQEAALGNELAARFYLAWGKVKVAQTYMQEAYYGYAHWGAKAKTDQLEQRYPQLLRSVLQQPVVHSRSWDISASANRPSAWLTSTSHTSVATITSLSASFDLATIIKLSQSLSREMHWDRLLQTLMQVLLQNAGAHKGVLILPQEGQWTIAAVATRETTQTQEQVILTTIALDESQDVPVKVVYAVKNSLESMVVHDLNQTPLSASDSYLVKHQPKSFLCTPILNQRQLIGILYLENCLTLGAFTHDRLEILQLLTSQAAISLENAMLYNNLEQKVQQRTQELHDKNQQLSATLTELQRTQSQLIQSEKMSSLGQLVAGIAHEINNPIGFIYSNLNHAQEYYQTLLATLEYYQADGPSPSSQTQHLLQEIEFVRQDLPKLLDSMQSGASRIREIVLSLRNFARLDEAEVKPVDIHSGLDSTLLILHHRCQATQNRPAIQIVKEYSYLPNITCHAKQLNQVFMNLLINAIDALDIIDAHLWTGSIIPTITIRTEQGAMPASSDAVPDISSQGIAIRICDNGTGMSEAVKARIFEPFFTTKPIGQGTGLGLAVSYAIIAQQGGQITVLSEVGQGTEVVVYLPLAPMTSVRSKS